MVIHILTERCGVGREHCEALAARLAACGHRCEVLFSHRGCPAGDLMFILGYLKIVPPAALEPHRHNLVIHASDLPQGKGWSPVAWQIAEGKRSIPFTLFEAAEELDAGPIYFQRHLELDGTELFDEWRRMQWELIASMVLEFVELCAGGTPVARPQSGPESYYRRRTAADDQIDPAAPLADSFDNIRICDPQRYPAWFELRGRRYHIRIEPADETPPPAP